MRALPPLLALAMASMTLVASAGQPPVSPRSECAARGSAGEAAAVTWLPGPADDADELDRWCRGVGAPLLTERPGERGGRAPALDDLVVVTWNVHLAEGRLSDLVGSLRAGHLTSGRPVRHFVLLLQELFRRGPDVPVFGAEARSAYAITARDPRAPDAADYARVSGLSVLYVPSMRNGANVHEDRGSAIVSSEPLVDAVAFELPLERQRRVAVGAAVRVATPRGVERLNLMNVHLEPLSAPSSLWIFRNPRRRQVAAVLELLGTPRFAQGPGRAGAVLGGDFNTIQGGVEEDAYLQARAWSTSLAAEDRRRTHHMGRIDYLFFQLGPAWQATTVRLDETFGSDHHPVIGRFVAAPRTP